ncbi:MAG: hypothetical protein ABSH33_09400, partial [Steroidobacteraceae bacterium]
TTLRSCLVFVSLAALALAGSGSALAEGHASGGGHFGGAAGGHAYAGGGYRGGYGYGWHGGYGYGWHGGYGYGWRGGYYGGWGWGLGGLGLGLYFAALPLYYSTYWWGGIPYYYANNNYYVYDGNVGQYETVAPPQGLQNQVETQQEPVGTDLIAYPKNGQSADHAAKDKFECHQWAATQSGFDPTQGASAAATAGKRVDYMRAQAACVEGRGYSVK